MPVSRNLFHVAAEVSRLMAERGSATRSGLTGMGRNEFTGDLTFSDRCGSQSRAPKLRGLQFAHEKRRELFVEMGRNADFEARRFPRVITLHHLANFVQPGDDIRLIVRHG